MEWRLSTMNEVYSYMQQMQRELQRLIEQQMQLSLRCEELEKEVTKLRHQLEETKPIHIDTVNYKVQELSVQELKGTLTIGMSALADPKEIQKWLQQSGEGIQMNDLNSEETAMHQCLGED